MAIEIVDLPIDSMVIFHSYVNLPEGKPTKNDDTVVIKDIYNTNQESIW